jgi:cell fate regulator YaaT (PSP1 superfamily)
MKAEGEYRRGQEVVIRTDRGTETGQVLCEASEDALSHLDEPASGSILREMNEQDVADLALIDKNRLQLMDDVRKQVEKLGLNMQLVDVEQIFGRQRIVVYYVAEQRVDFRELVKILASMLSTRIEMRQIGVRDEAKLLADYGDCGKPVCCNTHLVKMPPVSMKMAKLQKATLDPTKISGRCGRLKCCLRYEFDTYDEIQKSLPNVGWRIVTRQGKAKVIAQQILAEQLLVETEDHRRMLIDASEVLSVIEKTAPPRKSKKKYKKPNPKSEQ